MSDRVSDKAEETQGLPEPEIKKWSPFWEWPAMSFPDGDDVYDWRWLLDVASDNPDDPETPEIGVCGTIEAIAWMLEMSSSKSPADFHLFAKRTVTVLRVLAEIPEIAEYPRSELGPGQTPTQVLLKSIKNEYETLLKDEQYDAGKPGSSWEREEGTFLPQQSINEFIGAVVPNLNELAIEVPRGLNMIFVVWAPHFA